MTPRLTILYRDEFLVAVDKPSGLLVHRGWGRDRVVAMGLLRDQLGRRVLPMHRLDRGTSGVLLFAFEAETVRLWQEQLAASAVDKRYLALVRGVPPLSGVIDHPVPKEPKSTLRLPAVTEFRRLAVSGRYSLVEARPRTGRAHQIRRHMKHRSWPLIGDVNYGKGEHNRLFRERYGLHRLALHALVLKLAHPVSKDPLMLRAPLPEDLWEPLRQLRLEPSIDSILDPKSGVWVGELPSG